MSYINEVYPEAIARHGFQFMPLWTVIADESGNYTAYGKDRSGVTQRLRGDRRHPFHRRRLRTDRREDRRATGGPGFRPRLRPAGRRRRPMRHSRRHS